MSVPIPTLQPATVELLLNSHCIGRKSHWAVLKASGPTIRDYLQGQVSQDIQRLTPDQGIHTMILTPQGKAVGELYILEGHDGELVMLSPAGTASDLVARLRQFAVGHQVRIGIVDSLAACTVQGANASEGLKGFGLSEPGDAWLSASRHEDRDVFALTMPADPRGFWVIADPDTISMVLDSPHHVDDTQIETMRIIRGLICFGREWDAAIQPMNANMVEFDAVSFDKGCYVGQEVISRMHWRNGVKKRFYRVELDAMPAKLPSPLICSPAPGTQLNIGELRSAAADHHGQGFGIAWLPIETVEAGKALQLPDGSAVKVLEACHA